MSQNPAQFDRTKYRGGNFEVFACMEQVLADPGSSMQVIGADRPVSKYVKSPRGVEGVLRPVCLAGVFYTIRESANAQRFPVSWAI